MQANTIFLLLGILCLSLVTLVIWLRRLERAALLRLPLVTYEDGTISFHNGGLDERVVVDDIKEIRHSWTSAVFYAAQWEIDGKSGVMLKIDSKTNGLEELLLRLEGLLARFLCCRGKARREQWRRSWGNDLCVESCMIFRSN